MLSQNWEVDFYYYQYYLTAEETGLENISGGLLGLSNW